MNRPTAPKQNECHKTRLAESPLGSVDACQCGMVHLNIGAITLRLAPCVANELLALLGQAVAEQAAERARELPRAGLHFEHAFADAKRGEA